MQSASPDLVIFIENQLLIAEDKLLNQEIDECYLVCETIEKTILNENPKISKEKIIEIKNKLSQIKRKLNVLIINKLKKGNFK